MLGSYSIPGIEFSSHAKARPKIPAMDYTNRGLRLSAMTYTVGFKEKSSTFLFLMGLMDSAVIISCYFCKLENKAKYSCIFRVEFYSYFSEV
jgi:hypothetical protein